MKKIYLGALALAVGFSATAQSKLGLTTQPLKSSELKVNSNVGAKVGANGLKSRKADFFSEDFSNGLAGQGSNGAWTTSNVNSPGALWIYTGPNTTPSNASPTQGPCNAGTVVASPTTDNGFMVFDGNYYDFGSAADGATCAGASLGQGPFPGPHTSYLTSPTIDLSAVAGSASLSLYYAIGDQSGSFDLVLDAEFSNDNGATWVSLAGDGDITDANSENFGANEYRQGTLSLIIADTLTGSATSKLRFKFSGLLYHWIIDDVAITEPILQDYSIETTYIDDIRNEGLDYQSRDLPLNQAHLITPGVVVKQSGIDQADLTVSISVVTPSGTAGPFTSNVSLLKDSTKTVFIPTFTPTEAGNYVLTYTISSNLDSLDLNLADNVATRTISVSSTVNSTLWADEYSRSVRLSFIPEVDEAPGESEIFQVFKTYGATTTVNGIDFVIMNPGAGPDEEKITFEDDELQINVYAINDIPAYVAGLTVTGAPFKKSELLTPVASKIITVTSAMITQSGQPTIVNTEFFDVADIPSFTQDKLFAISIQNLGGGYLSIPTTSPGTNVDGSGLVRARGILTDPSLVDDDELLFFSNVNPWIRARTSPSTVGVSENELSKFIGNAVPNPSNGLVSVSYELLTAADVVLTVTDLSGKMVIGQSEGRKAQGSNKLTFDVSNLESGVYFYSVSINDNTTTRKLVVTN